MIRGEGGGGGGPISLFILSKIVAEFDKLPLETEPLAHGNNVVLTSKLCPQTSFMPYSTDNRSIPNRHCVSVSHTRCYTLDDFDTADPSSMQDACHTST